tara:strand:+ start:360 stop:584 length:225 start_codon:yes stop_codon:yes gene_type:complete
MIYKFIYLIYMPYKIRKVRGKDCYKVYKPKDGKVFAKCTTRKNAEKQIRLLRAIQFNKSFKPNSKNNRTRKISK